MADVWLSMKSLFARRIFTKENLWALVFCLILIALIIITSDSAPLWIYQGF